MAVSAEHKGFYLFRPNVCSSNTQGHLAIFADGMGNACQTTGTPVLRIGNDGGTDPGLEVVQDGLTVTAGGLTVTAGGFTLTAGVLTLPAGAECAPSLTFACDTDTGIFQSADTVAITAGGVELITAVEAATDEVVINQDGCDVDFRVESDCNTTLITTNGAEDSIGFGAAGATAAFMSLTWGAQNRDIASGTGMAIDIPAETLTIADAACTTNAIGAVIAVATPTIAATNASNTITDGATLYIAAAPAASCNVTITTSHALWVDAGDARFDGTTTLNTVAYTWPGADGCACQQLTTNGSGTLSWAAASKAAYKHDLGPICTNEILATIVETPIHRFTYDPSRVPAGQRSPSGEFIGVFAEEAPWAMQGDKKGAFSPINAFGHAAAAIQALNKKVDHLEGLVRLKEAC